MTRASDTAKLLGAGATILDGTTISTADNTDQLTLISTDADASRGPRLALTRNSGSPADNDIAGTIKINAKNDANEDIELFEINTTLMDASDGTEDARMIFNGIIGGAAANRLNLNSTETVFNDDSVDLDFRVESNGNANMIHVDGGNDKVGIGIVPTARLSLPAQASGDSGIARLAIESAVDSNDFTIAQYEDSNGTYTQIGQNVSLNSGGSTTVLDSGHKTASILFDGRNNGALMFQTGGDNSSTEHLRLDSTGNLGLNTGSSTGRATGIGMEILHVGTDTSATLRLTGENGSSAESFSEITHAGDVRHMNFKHNGATRLQIDANGGVLVDGGSVGSVSDSRVKKDVEDLSDGLSIVKQLRPVKFKYKGNTEYYNGDDKTYHGFIADEVKAIAPQYITEVTNKIYDDEFDGSNIVDFDEELKDKKFTSVDDFKTMSQTDLIPMLVKAIQELSAKVTALENA